MKHKHWIHCNTLRRAMAANAVSQHPYHAPPKLFNVIEDFVKSFSPDSLGMARIDTRTFRDHVFDFCRNHPVCQRWNIARSGKRKYTFCSAFFSTKPEHDFIDLEALACNIIRYVLSECDEIKLVPQFGWSVDRKSRTTPDKPSQPQSGGTQ